MVPHGDVDALATGATDDTPIAARVNLRYEDIHGETGGHPRTE